MEGVAPVTSVYQTQQSSPPALVSCIISTCAYFTVEVKQVSPVLRSGVFEHGTKNVEHSAVPLRNGGLGRGRGSGATLIWVLWTRKRGPPSTPEQRAVVPVTHRILDG